MDGDPGEVALQGKSIFSRSLIRFTGDCWWTHLREEGGGERWTLVQPCLRLMGRGSVRV